MSFRYFHDSSELLWKFYEKDINRKDTDLNLENKIKFSQSMGIINYPPEKIYSPSKLKKPNYVHIILWMLDNNDMCKWGDFRQEPVEIPTGTLSRHLETLKRKV